MRLSVTGIVNGRPLRASGTLAVDASAGTKDGTITYDATPGGVAPGPDCTMMSTGRCFIGARRLGGRSFVGPVDLLGRDFVSLRVTKIGRFGTVSISETGTLTDTELRSELTVVGDYRGPKTRAMGPLRETITVVDDGTLSSEGRYSLVPVRGRPIPATYTHFYRPLQPVRRMFARLDGTKYLLRAKITPSVRGKALRYHSESTLAPVPSR